MQDYTLYYWPVPFRGEFIRAVLAHVHARWDEADMPAIQSMWQAQPERQPIPHMGPPMLLDHGADVCLAQMPAILMYLGRKHKLLPEHPLKLALSEKVIADANDVLYEMTRYNGAQMWDDTSWADYRPRLLRWMQILEETGRRQGLQANAGTLLGTPAYGVADLTAHILWGTMSAKFPRLRALLENAAPAICGLSDRIAALPEQAELRRRSDRAYGTEWCSGDIEASLRRVLPPP